MVQLRRIYDGGSIAAEASQEQAAAAKRGIDGAMPSRNPPPNPPGCADEKTVSQLLGTHPLEGIAPSMPRLAGWFYYQYGAASAMHYF